MYAGEAQGEAVFFCEGRVCHYSLSSVRVGPAGKTHSVGIEKEVAGGLAGTDQKGGEGIGAVALRKGAQIGIGQDIHIVNQEVAAAFEECPCVEDCPTGFQKHSPFIADAELHPVLPFAPVLHLVGKMMDIHHGAVKAAPQEFAGDYFNQRMAVHRHKGLGHRVGQGFEAGAQARGEYH